MQRTTLSEKSSKARLKNSTKAFTMSFEDQRQAKRLRGVLLKCGGFSSQLANNVSEKVDGDPLWGSRFDWTHPSAVVQTHLDFLLCGADIILSNTYQSSVDGFIKYLGLTREQSIDLMAKSVHLAQQARELYMEQLAPGCGHLEPGLPLVLASIGPYGAHLHDGSEYSGGYADKVTKEQLQKWHSTRIDTCLKQAGADGLAVETIPCQIEAEAVTDLILREHKGVKFWVSFQCKDEVSLAHGESFAQAALSIWRIVQSHNAQSCLLGIGVNCVNPSFVSPLFISLNAAAGEERIPLIVYSNRGETYDSDKGEWIAGEDLKPLVDYVPEWCSLGACIIGGCCRVYPADILQMRQCIDNIGNNN
ncbi:homocysteine S-methyltransferase 2 [Scaptodrosophila lebanonensis]|uniref:Homocysteine S-methyltransferase 2 n=1 Tax=Drosophila lebanonensis TaxID=7225 RepID=A0A6J2U971_DROLE|nr:homocysteine S-methyltransferase 2 [Scaptodrosophila lebanonensis]